MKEEYYKIIENDGIDIFTSRLLKEYWSFKNFENTIYTCTVKKLSEKFNLHMTDLIAIVRINGYLKVKVLLDCKQCYGDINVYIRKELANLKGWKHQKLFCESCYRSSINDSGYKFLSEFKRLLPNSFNVERVPEKPDEDLTYLESIFLYTLIAMPECQENGLVPEYIWQNFINLEAVNMDYIFNSLLDKRYIFKRDYDRDILNLHESIKYASAQLDDYLDLELKQELTVYSKLDINNNIYINLPKGYDNVMLWVGEVYNKIINFSLCLDDIKEIENYILAKRLAEVYFLLDYICDSKKIPVTKDNALELELLRMLTRYNLNDSFSLLNYQSRETMAYLYELHAKDKYSFSYKKYNVYRMKISSYLNHLEFKDEKPKYPRDLPLEWSISEVELFVSMHIIKNYQKWEKFTPSEIIEMWLSAVEIDSNS